MTLSIHVLKNNSWFKQGISLFVVLLLMSSLNPAASFANEAPLLVSPEVTRLQASAGETVVVPITIQNQTNSFNEVRVSIQNNCPSSDTLGIQEEKSNVRYGIQNWSTDANINKVLTIPAQQSVEYEATFKVPSQAVDGSYYGCAVIESTDTSKSSTAFFAYIVITIGEPQAKLSITNLSFDIEPSEAHYKYGSFLASIYNNGNAIADPSPLLRITDSTGATVARLEPAETRSILPDHANYYTFAPDKPLPREALTATLTTTDQYGNATDKAIQFVLQDQQDTTANLNSSQYTDETSLQDILTFLGVSIVIISAIIFEIRTTFPHPPKQGKKTKNSSRRARAKS